MGQLSLYPVVAPAPSPAGSKKKERKSKAAKGAVPDGFEEASLEWHLERFIEFTAYKGEIGEPSPHLAIVGYLGKRKKEIDRLWLLGCYGATYCLPTAQVIWSLMPADKVAAAGRTELQRWLQHNWGGIVTRTERRCVRSPKNMADCLWSCRQWIDNEFPALKKLPRGDYSHANYETVWDSASRIQYFGRYINIRFIEGLRRYHNIPARLYDIRSIGGWSPKRCLAYLFPQHVQQLLTDNREGDELTDALARQLLATVREKLPKVDEYILAAMLCEFKGAFENRHQFPSWTISQEPELYDKVSAYWGSALDKKALWAARKALFPKEVLGEISGWNGIRWELTKTLRDYKYNWSDLRYNWHATLASGDFRNPVKWDHRSSALKGGFTDAAWTAAH